jgi:hypothetical protein
MPLFLSLLITDGVSERRRRRFDIADAIPPAITPFRALIYRRVFAVFPPYAWLSAAEPPIFSLFITPLFSPLFCRYYSMPPFAYCRRCHY